MKRLVFPISDRNRARFWEKVDKAGGSDACWPWRGNRKAENGGYGLISVGTELHRAHRVSWQLENGDPGGLFVCHACDNPPCVNPRHLFLGTNRENHDDMRRKGRGFVPTAPRGSMHYRSKLTEAQVDEIRSVLAAPYYGVGSALARQFGVSPSVISDIRHNKARRHG